MKIIALLTVLLISLCSCQKRLKSQPSTLQAYQQYHVLAKLKKELRGERLNVVMKEELIALGEELAPQDAEIQLIKAATLRVKGEKEQAKLTLENALRLSPNHAPAFLAYGQFLISNGFREEGRSYCLHAKKLNPIDIAARICAKQ